MNYETLATELQDLGHDARAVFLPGGVGWLCEVYYKKDHRLELGWLDGENVGLVTYLPPDRVGSDPLYPIVLDDSVIPCAQSWSDKIATL